MQFDPKLKVAMEEIKAVLKKHDIAGVVVLHNNDGPGHGHGEYAMVLDPSYSCASLNEGMVRLKELPKLCMAKLREIVW